MAETTRDGVAETTRDGGTVVVEVDRGDAGSERRVAYTMQRLSADATVDGEPRRVITEQALRSRVLRNTLSFFEEAVETVRLRDSDRYLTPFGFDAEEPQVVEYAGLRYQIASEKGA